MDYTSSCYEFTDHIKEQLFPNLFESVDDTNSTKPKTEDQKKKELKKQQKEQQAYKPETKTSRALEIKQRCDKLFNDTQS
jgi:DNA-binding GntR family transcriptional regulator